MKAWYFSTEDRKLQHGDGRMIEVGATHKVDCEPVLCNAGLHASKRPIDALRYAPGPILWRVELGGTIVKGDDKLCATDRTYLWGFDATAMLREFARKCALDVIHLWDAPEVVKTYLATGDESLRAAAWAAAGDAAWDAAWDAARAAAWAAAWAATRAAARAAAWDAAWDAAWAAAGAAAGAAAWDAAWDAAWAAAGAAAWAAAWDAQNRRLLAMIRKAKP